MFKCVHSASNVPTKHAFGWNWELSRDQGCGCSGRTEIELGRKVGTKPGLKPGREEWCLDCEGRDVVKTALRPTEAGKTATKKKVKLFIHVLSSFQ